MCLIVLNVCVILIIVLKTLNLVERLMYIVRGNNNNEIAKTRRHERRLNAFIWSHLRQSI
jgi:uncharacterized protein YpmS